MQIETIDEAERPEQIGEFDRRGMVRDAIVVLAITAALTLLSVRFEVSEAIFAWTRRFEGLQFDELLLMLLALASGFMWFALRRYREAGLLLQRQREIDARLACALTENRRLAQQYLDSQESERRSIARELHDELGQYLNAIKIDAVSIRKECEANPGAILDSANAIAKNVDYVYTRAAGLIRQLRPVGLDELGLVAALEHCVDQWRSRLADTEISLRVEGPVSALDEQASLTVYRIVQECLTNIAKHANARRAAIAVHATAEPNGKTSLTLHISDDGRGVDLQIASGRFGLVSMRERVAMRGGRFDVQSAPGRGFRVIATFSAEV